MNRLYKLFQYNSLSTQYYYIAKVPLLHILRYFVSLTLAIYQAYTSKSNHALIIDDQFAVITSLPKSFNQAQRNFVGFIFFWPCSFQYNPPNVGLVDFTPMQEELGCLRADSCCAAFDLLPRLGLSQAQFATIVGYTVLGVGVCGRRLLMQGFYHRFLAVSTAYSSFSVSSIQGQVRGPVSLLKELINSVL